MLLNLHPVLLKFHPVQALTACMDAYATCKQAIHKHDQHCLLELQADVNHISVVALVISRSSPPSGVRRMFNLRSSHSLMKSLDDATGSGNVVAPKPWNAP